MGEGERVKQMGRRGKKGNFRTAETPDRTVGIELL